MKLLAAGVVLSRPHLRALFTDLNPAALFIAGIACTFLGAISLLSLSYGLGAGVSASDTSEAVDLVNANNRDSAAAAPRGSTITSDITPA